MPFKPGDPKPPNSGRKIGSPKKLTVQVRGALEDVGCNPALILASIAMKMENDDNLRREAARDLMPYVFPKLSSVQHLGPGGGPIQHVIDPFEAIRSELARLSERSRTNGHAAEAD